jgi:Cu(I)/Ag(I) efflux system membrane protein CusA/SilA
MRHTPLDAIPDLSDVQVIVYTPWEGRSPDLVEDQVTYPIVTKLIAAPAREGRARLLVLRLLVRLRHLRRRHGHLLGPLARAGVPAGPAGQPAGRRHAHARARTRPAWAGASSTRWWTGAGRHDLADLRSFQDWYLRYWLQSIEGVAEVAPFGGFEKQYQVELDPSRLLNYGITLDAIVSAIRAANNDVGGRELERNGTTYLVRGRGYIKSLEDLRQVVVGRDAATRHAHPAAGGGAEYRLRARTCGGGRAISTARARWWAAWWWCATARTCCP